MAIESTGVYWIPVWNILERKKWKLEPMLVNPVTVRALRGQKTGAGSYLGDRDRVINRIGRLPETVNIKPGAVASHIAGKGGRAILERLTQGSCNAEELANLA